MAGETKGNLVLFTNAMFYVDPEKKVNNILAENGKVKAYDVDPADYINAEVVDLKGGFVYPGFNDSHVHLVEVGSVLEGAMLRGCATSGEIAEVLAGLDKKMPEGDLMVGNGFYPDDYDAWSLEDLKTLDEAAPNRPVLIFDELGHNAVINSNAIKECGITAETPVPIGGKVVMEDGKPTGMLRETAMLLAGNKLMKLIKKDEIKKGAKKLFDLWASKGYTSIVDMSGAPFGRILHPDVMRELEQEDRLPLRINYTYTFFDLEDIDNAPAYKGKDTDRVRFHGLKLYVDGAFAGGEAWTSWENLQGGHGLHCVYFDDKYGEKYNINRIIEKVNELGLNIHYHIQGDEGLEVVLDAIEKAKKKKGQLTSTHTLIHLGFPTDEQIDHIKRLAPHVNATMQPGFWAVEASSDRYYGERSKSCYPAKKIMDAGISVGLSTDFSVSPIELTAPTKIMNIAMTGSGDPENHVPLTMKDLITGFTQGSAATTPIPDTGKLEPGYWADFVVFEEDLYSMDPEKMDADTPKVLSTWVGGEKVNQ